MAEAGPHDRVELSLSIGDKGIDRQGGQAVRLDRDGPVPVVLDKVLKCLVSQLRERLHAVHGLSQAEKSRPRRERFEKSLKCAPDAGGTVTREGPAGLGDGGAIGQFPPSIQRM